MTTTKPGKPNHHNESAAFVANELKKAKERVKQLERGLYEVFPVEAYRMARPDVAEACDNDTYEIIEHYLAYGINELDIEKEGIKYRLGLYQHIKEAASLLAIEVDKLNEKTQKNETALKNSFSKDFAIKTTESCLRNLNSSGLPQQDEGSEAGDRRLELLKTKADSSKLEENIDHNFAIWHSSFHYRSKTLCTWIPKNGCSNLRYAIAKENGAIGDRKDMEWSHQNNQSFNASTKEALQAAYTFVILRNPFKRLLSFFLDKLCHTQVQNDSDRSREYSQRIFKFNENLSYSDFIDYIWKHPETIYKDAHTRPQCDFLLYRNYDSYYTLENIAHANEMIQKKTGIDVEDIRATNSIFTTKDHQRCKEINSSTKAGEINQLLKAGKIPFTENMYTRDMIKKVACIYLQDIMLYREKISDSGQELDYWINHAISKK